MTTIYYRAQIDKEKLREIILKNPGCLLHGLNFIDQQLGTEEEGVIDCFGVDKTGGPVIVNFGVTDNNDQILVDALSQMQWLKKNENFLKRLYLSENVDFNQSPQIVIVAASFSDKLKYAAKQLLWHDIRLIEYRYTVAADKDAIIFEEVFYNKRAAGVRVNAASPKPELKEVLAPEPGASFSPVQADTASEAEEITLTPEEMAEFLDFDRALDKEKTVE
ncbi:MAG: hypothetical protein KJ893_07325 [Candidatus Omnitrophica bacterium]|nr:hypothetical protein [Candidatus Omnitrophota bacterium]MBU4479666.1 hypothetical protein [Candidatus Omnitrophota bacterium]MCG2703654.1 hypothetical protein [Candidatus Omnitrophota bacterium]